MKAKLKKNILFLISTFALLFASCSNFNTSDESDVDNSNFGNGQGSIRISLGNNARTAYPILDTDEFDKWTWTIKGRPSTSTDEAEWEVLKVWSETTKTFLEGSTVGVRSGTWKFLLTAEKITSITTESGTGKKTVTTYSGIGKSGETDEFVIVDGEPTVTVPFNLMLTQLDTDVTGKGNLSIEVKYTSSAVSKIEGALFKAPSFNGVEAEVTLDAVEPTGDEASDKYSKKQLTNNTYSLTDVPAGKYVAVFYFYDSNGNKLNANGYEEYVQIVDGLESKSTVNVTSLDDVYSITYIPAPSVNAKGSYTRHSGTIVLPAAKKVPESETPATEEVNELDSGTVLFCGWYDNPDYSGSPVTEFNASVRGNKVFYGKYINAKEAVALPEDLTLSYLDSNITSETDKEKAQVGNTIMLPADKIPASTCVYEWFRGSETTWEQIAGASGTSYKLVNADVGKNIKLKVTKTYEIGDEANTERTLYHTVKAIGSDYKEITLLSGDATVQKGTLDLSGITIQYSGKVLVGGKPVKSNLILSGILKDIYGNTISNSLLKGDFADYAALSASAKLDITIDVEGYTLSSASSAQVYVTVQNVAPTGIALRKNGDEGESVLEKGKIAFTAATVALGNLEYSTDGNSWRDVTADQFTKPGGTLYVRYKQIKTAGEVGYLMASPAVSVVVATANVGIDPESGSGSGSGGGEGGGSGSSEDNEIVLLMTGAEINEIFTDNFARATAFLYTDDTAPSGAVTISDSTSTVEVKAWMENKTIYVTASGYSGKIHMNADSSCMFDGLSRLKTIDLTNFSTKAEVEKYEAVTNLASMFSGCSALTTVVFDPDFDTSKVTDMSNMFDDTGSLEELDLSGFDTSCVTKMNGMFTDSGVVELDLTSFNTANVSDMTEMFAGCGNLESLIFGNSFNTANVTKMDKMFQDLELLKELDLSNFNTEKVESMSYMFAGATKLEMLNLSKFNTSSVSNMKNMFARCSALTKIYVTSLWSTESVTATTSGVDMFKDCTQLTGGNGTVYDEFNIGVTYAVIDTPGTPGYLTKLGE